MHCPDLCGFLLPRMRNVVLRHSRSHTVLDDAQSTLGMPVLLWCPASSRRISATVAQ